jgi:Diacylglycerol kinase
MRCVLAKPGNTGLYRIFKATGYSLQGLQSAWKNEAAFRQELMLVLVLTPLAFWLGEGLTQQLLLMIVAWLVVIVEILNSGIEAVVDRIGSEHHELSGRAKDLGSAAVFLSLTLTIVVWGSVAASNLLGLW